MVRQIERDRPFFRNHSEMTNNELPHGVSPETYGLLLFARDHKEVLDRVDSLDKGKKTVNPTRNLIVVYYGTDASLRDVAKSTGIGRTTNAKRILRGLEIIWEQLPKQIQLQYLKEKAVRLKENASDSPRTLKKKSSAATILWKDENYRKKALEGIRGRKNNQEFIQKMREIGRAKPPPMEGKTHSQQTVVEIAESVQANWNRWHAIESTDDPLAKRKVLLTEWIKLTRLLKHAPSSKDITRLCKEGKTRFSITMYKKEFGQGSFTKAREILTCINSIYAFATSILQNPSEILSRPILEKDIKPIHKTVMTELKSILSAPSIEEMEEKAYTLNDKTLKIKRELDTKKPHYLAIVITKDEELTWQYAIEHNLIDDMLKANIMKQSEIDLLKTYFENGIIGENLTETIFNRFTVAVARIS